MDTPESGPSGPGVALALFVATLAAGAIAWWASEHRTGSHTDAADHAAPPDERPAGGADERAPTANAPGETDEPTPAPYPADTAPVPEPGVEETTSLDGGHEVDGDTGRDAGAATTSPPPTGGLSRTGTQPAGAAPSRAPRQVGTRSGSAHPVRERPTGSSGMPIPPEVAPPGSRGTGPIRVPPGPDPLPLRR